jgi:hypothetical protein
VDPEEEMTEMNGHDGALAIHGDQDVYGTPIRQILKGLAPRILRHQTPDGRNTRAPLMLVNIWIPLQQIVRPLVLMDRRSLDPHKQQLRYALPTGAFLERDQDREINDIWTFLYNEHQRWHFTAEMDTSRAYVFDTLGLAHGAAILPGEDVAEQCYKALMSAIKALDQNHRKDFLSACQQTFSPLHLQTTVPLKKAVEGMQALLAQGRKEADKILASPGQWKEKASQAMDRVTRKSIELRVLAWCGWQ